MLKTNCNLATYDELCEFMQFKGICCSIKPQKGLYASNIPRQMIPMLICIFFYICPQNALAGRWGGDEFVIAGKEPTRYCGINLVGLRRHGFSKEQIDNIHEAYRLLYSKGLLKEGIEEIKKNLELTPEINYIINFVSTSKRGIIR